MRTLLLLCVLLVFSDQVAPIKQIINPEECGYAPASPRIVNGTLAKEDYFPWMVSMKLRFGKDLYSCAGAILTSYTVITAAHCTFAENRSAEWIMVFYGSIKKHSGISVPVTRMLRHPFFVKESFQNDVCLLTVQKPMRFNEMVKPICLPLNPVDLYQKNVRIAGWGRLNVSLPTTKLYYTSITVLPSHLCMRKYAGNDFNKKLMFCAYGGYTDACSGDSGAPVLSQAEDGRFFIVGIISYGVGCAVDGRPAVYARVSTYAPWILRNIGKAQKYTRLSLE